MPKLEIQGMCPLIQVFDMPAAVEFYTEDAREILIELGAISEAGLGALVFGQRGESRIVA